MKPCEACVLSRQPRPASSASSHRGTVVEVDLRVEGKPQMEERDAEDSDEYSEEETWSLEIC